jgi:hypothetical protein
VTAIALPRLSPELVAVDLALILLILLQFGFHFYQVVSVVRFELTSAYFLRLNILARLLVF